MKLKKMVIVAALTVPTLGACGKADSTQSSAVKGDDSSKDKKTVFNLAEYLQTSDYNETDKLSEFLKTGDIIFGDLNKIGIRSNVKVETSGKTRLTPSGNRNITGTYFLNGSVYPRGVKMPDGTVISSNGIKTKDGIFYKNIFKEDPKDPSNLTDEETKELEYSIIDVQAKAGFDYEGIEGHFRFLGDDKYPPISYKTEYHFKQMRDLSLSYPLFPGAVVKASIGGEIEFTAKVKRRNDDAITLQFVPEMAITSKIEPRIKAYIASIGVEGELKLIETKVSTSASVSYLPDEDFTYGDISMDATSIKALDGKVSVFTKIGFNTLLENILDTVLPVNSVKLWQKISSFLNIDLDKTWKYTVWDPAPVLTGSIPARGVFFTSDTKGMSSDDCRAIRDQVYAAGDVMEKASKKGDKFDMDIAYTAQANLAKTALFLNSNCGK